MSPSKIKYYDLRKNWRKVKRHLENPRVADTLVRDFNKFTYGKWRKRFTAGQVPFEFENYDCWLQHRGRHPQFWQYVQHEASHWLANFALELAQLVEPDRKWRIITDKHSTVWDGEDTLFEFNFLALGIPPKQCFELAYEHELKPGQHRKCGYPDHYTVEMKQLARDRALIGNIPASNDEAMMTQTAYRISDLPVGKTIAYQEIRGGRLTENFPPIIFKSVH